MLFAKQRKYFFFSFSSQLLHYMMWSPETSYIESIQVFYLTIFSFVFSRFSFKCIASRQPMLFLCGICNENCIFNWMPKERRIFHWSMRAVCCECKWKENDWNDDKRSMVDRNKVHLFSLWHAKSNKLQPIYFAHNFLWISIEIKWWRIRSRYLCVPFQWKKYPTQRIALINVFTKKEKNTPKPEGEKKISLNHDILNWEYYELNNK